MGKKKGSFVNYDLEEILIYESLLFVIQVGKEFFEVNGEYSFTENVAVSHCKEIAKLLADDLKNGTPRQKRRASKVLPSLRVVPLRFH